jgi:eukaryotic-like serine/threonine-protein kinase
MLPATALPEQSRTLVFSDGLGERFAFAEGATRAPVQVLRLRPEMTDVPAFEFALRERAARLANFRTDAYPTVYRIVQMRGPSRELALVSEHLEGHRLSTLLRVAEQHQVPVELSTALSVTHQLLQATSLFHGHAADIVNGLLAPERIVLTPGARIAVVEHVLSVAIEQLRYGRERLWRELRIPTCAAPGPVRFTRRSDVLSIGLVTLALVLGRPLREEEFPGSLPTLLDGARERSMLGYERSLSPRLHDWLSCALQLDSHRSFATVPDALRAFEAMLAGDPLYLPVPSAIERFLQGCAAALVQPPVPDSPAPAAAPNPPALSSPAPASRPETAPRADPTVASKGEPEIVVQMLPPPGVSDGALDVDAAGQPDAIDWTAISAGPETVVTADDIAQLFVASEVTSGARGIPEPIEPGVTLAAVVPDPDLPPLPTVPVDEIEPGGARLFDTASPAMFRLSWPALPAPASWMPRWRRVAAAAVLVGVLAGGTALYRLARPAVVVASEMGTLAIDTDPGGLPVLIDGIERGHTPARLAVSSGEHLVEVRGPGGPRVVPIEVTGGAEVAHYIEFGTELSPPSQPVAALPTAGIVPSGEPAAAPAAAREAAPTWGWLEVKSPTSLGIRFGGKVIGRTGGERVRFGEGRHEIELVNPETGERTPRVVHIVPGKVTMVTVAEAATGLVNLNAAPWAEVWIGDRRIGETPLANVTVPVGRHQVVFRHPELGEKRETISVTAGVPVRISVDMR